MLVVFNALVTQDLSQSNEIVVRLSQVTMSKRMAKLVSRERNAGDGSILRADRTQTRIR